jgi:hypothetical protein
VDWSLFLSELLMAVDFSFSSINWMSWFRLVIDGFGAILIMIHTEKEMKIFEVVKRSWWWSRSWLSRSRGPPQTEEGLKEVSGRVEKTERNHLPPDLRIKDTPPPAKD